MGDKTLDLPHSLSLIAAFSSCSLLVGRMQPCEHGHQIRCPAPCNTIQGSGLVGTMSYTAQKGVSVQEAPL